AFHIGAGSNAHEKIRGLVRRQSGVAPRAIERRKDVGRGRERADAPGDSPHLHLLIADLGAGPDPTNPEPVEIRAVDRDGAWDREVVDAAFDHVPGEQSSGAQIGADDEYRSRPSPWHAPIRVADDDRNGLRHTVDRERLEPLALV